MTDAPAAIKGCFADFKLIKTRRVCQIVIEVALEEADAALETLGGLPRPDQERWVALARLDQKRQPETPVAPAKERRAFCDLPFPQQAALKSGDPAFQKFMRAASEQDCAAAICHVCGVDSRSKILKGSDSGYQWLDLLREFEGRR